MKLDFSKIKTFPAEGRNNLVLAEKLLVPGESTSSWTAEGFDDLCKNIKKARERGRPVIFFMGAHVIKCGLSRYLISMMEQGLITHLAGNGACSIHDFELAYLGGTSEHVPTAIEDGSFGMWEETGAWMNEAIQEGASAGLGYGESLAVYMERHTDRFPHSDICVLYQAHRLGVPATYHVALGTDIIHQHPKADFAAYGATSGVDFKKFCKSTADLDGGVFLNFGSGVIGPEVFLKAISIVRNLGYMTRNITTANFDLRVDSNDYYYRPLKNIVTRPTSTGGAGWHFCGDHRETIPALYGRYNEKI